MNMFYQKYKERIWMEPSVEGTLADEHAWRLMTWWSASGMKKNEAISVS